MNKLFTLLITIFLASTGWAQSPEQMSYQAVIRGIEGLLVQNQTVGLQISLLQGATDGIAIYTETHTTITNDNGLVSLSIGTGTTTDEFSAVNWANGPYFIKTETDPSGGTDYTITGTSQILSVPYSLHAKTAEKAENGISSEQVNAIAGNTALLSALETRIAALEREPILGAVIGEFREGGIVFWVDPTDNTHGLVCAVEDQSSGLEWYSGSYVSTGATGSAIGTGKSNTEAIIAARGSRETNYAAGLVKAYRGGGYDDWFLPSREELDQMFLNLISINTTALENGGSGFFNEFYWSSTDGGSNRFAYVRSFNYGNRDGSSHSKNMRNNVRAVRAF